MKIAVLKGDGIGPEIVEAAQVVLNKVNEKFELGDLVIFPFSIPHDASDPCGFNIFYQGNISYCFITI